MVVVNHVSAPLFVVFGATGKQGGSAVDHLVDSKHEYRIRCPTRSLNSPASIVLKSLGAELVQVNLDLQRDLDSAVRGADYVFVVLDSSMGVVLELTRAKAIIAALSSLLQVPVIIWSSLPPAAEISKGRYIKVSQFDNKARIVQATETAGLQIISVEPGMYMENWLGILKPRLGQDGSYAISLPADPKSQVALLSVRRDLGGFVVAAAESSIRSGRILAFGDEVSFEDLAHVWGKGEYSSSSLQTP